MEKLLPVGGREQAEEAEYIQSREKHTWKGTIDDEKWYNIRTCDDINSYSSVNPVFQCDYSL